MNPLRILIPSIEVLKNKSDAYIVKTKTKKHIRLFSVKASPPTACTFRVAADEA